MGQAADRDGAAAIVDALFDHAAFADLKNRASPFVVVRPASREVIWANGAAEAFWRRPVADLDAALFGPPGRGWLGRALAAIAPGRAPQMLRTGLSPGLGMHGRVVLARAVSGPDGTVLAGFAVPGSAAGDAAPEAWRQSSAPLADAAGTVPDESGPSLAPSPSGVGDREADAGSDLARRSQLAVLRDRLTAAIDGAASLRFLWRTDARGVLTTIDETLKARLGVPLASGGEPLPDVVARFDPAAGERLAAAFASGGSWSSLPVRLPVAGGAAVVPALVSGSPVFGRARAVEGFRGFGLVDLAGLEPAQRGAAAATADDASPAPDPDLDVPPAASTSAAPGSDRDPEAAAGADRDSSEVRPAEPSDTAVPMPGTEPASRANVVDFRPFQPGRATPPAPAETERLAAEESADLAPPLADDAASPDDRQDASEPVSDEMAFLALGAALRARLGDEDPKRGSGVADAGAEESGGPDPTAPEGGPSSAEIASLLEHLPIPLLVVRGAEPIFANPAAGRRLGFDSVAQLLAIGPDLVHERTPSGLVLRDGQGDATAVTGEATAIAWGGGAMTLWTLGSTETASAAAPAPETERPLELVDRVDDAVALLDAGGRIRRLNERGRAWFAEQAVGRELPALLAPESRTAALHLLDEARMRGPGSGAAPPRREVTAVVEDGAVLPMLLTLGRLGTTGFYATLRDVSDLRLAERAEARSRAEREREAARLPDMIARVSHEIRTPLNAILGFAEVMIDERFGPLGSPRYRDYLKDIHESGTQVVTIVGDLLDLSRIEAGRIDLDVAALDVNKVVAEIVAQMQPEANRERVIVRTSLASRIPAVLADERSTRQIVQHLLSNAVKFNEPGGQVIVSTAQEDGGAVLLRIRDTGVGMTEAEIAAALEPFPDVAPRPANGNGLGLPLARALIGANGASLSIRSRPREGTLVEVSFPPAPPAHVRRPA